MLLEEELEDEVLPEELEDEVLLVEGEIKLETVFTTVLTALETVFTTVLTALVTVFTTVLTTLVMASHKPAPSILFICPMVKASPVPFWSIRAYPVQNASKSALKSSSIRHFLYFRQDLLATMTSRAGNAVVQTDA